MNQNENKKAGGISSLLGLNRTTRAGSYTLAMTLIVLAVLIVVNLLVGTLPSTLTKLDTTATDLYRISATTEKYVGSIDRDVNLIYIAEGGMMTPTLRTFLERYTALSSHVRIKTLDPVANPTVLDQYSKITSSGNYLIVESDLRYTVVDITGLNYVYVEDLNYTYTVDQYNSLMSNTALLQQAAQYGMDLSKATYYFGGESAVTSAIEYVATENIPHVYQLSGNGEGALSQSIVEMFDMVLLECEQLVLQAGDTIPELASCIIINAPQSDLTADTAKALIDYIADGGNLILVSTPANADMPNLMSVMATLGAHPTTGGMLYEGNANRYVGAPQNLIPAVNSQHVITYGVTQSENSYVMVMPHAHGILLDATLPEGVTATTLFSATDAYTVAADGKETDWGKVATGVALENSTTGSKVVWFASLDAFSDSTAAAYGKGATYYFAMATNYLNDGYASTLTAIEALDITTAPLSVSLNAALTLGGVTIIALPLVLVIAGIVVWIRRRRR
ncbi:MAG: Gldg family protein [Clostridia bacterium]|nr:Gldg family protein [Clostridia bacterium]